MTGPELTSFKEVSGLNTRAAAIAPWSRRAVLNAGMLLRDSKVARQVRTYLLDAETEVRTRSVDNLVHRPGWVELDERSSKVLHRADVPLYVATCAFTRESLAIAAQGGVTAVHRGLLEAWSAGVRLQVLR
ncbi:hypothetical protein [Streptomyces sp. NPDC003952]